MSLEVVCERKNGDGADASKILWGKHNLSNGTAVTGTIVPPTPSGSCDSARVLPNANVSLSTLILALGVRSACWQLSDEKWQQTDVLFAQPVQTWPMLTLGV